MDIREGEFLSFEVAGRTYSLPLQFSVTLPKGIAVLPEGLDGIPYVDLPSWALVKEHRMAEAVSVNGNLKNNQ
jgi:hypothetical protein